MPDAASYFHRWTKTLGFTLLKRVEALVAQTSLVGTTPFLAPDAFPWTQTLEANWTTIRAELDRVLEHRQALPNFQDISEDQAAITQDDRWKTFFLYGFGHKAERNCARCPATTRLVEQVPGMKTAFFSILAPGKHIPAHRGPYRGVVRYHLGLKVPTPATACRIRVADEVRHWEEGQSLLFDDTYDHEVWNDTDGERAILFMDVERPLREPMGTLNRLLLWLVGQSSFVQRAKRNQEAWEAQFAARPDTPADAPA
jgi:beta-hydroxylase